ncbi:MAG: DUF21 domain-containing protein [Planctomycetota bacterium]|nr:MAG: DUF21 domain-containing protein [Planctomycetota bacterium]
MSPLPAALLLLAGSAVFSGSEAALFTLAGRTASPVPRMARDLLRDPAGALTAILLGNLLVNLAFFAAAAAWGAGLGRSGQAAAAAGAVLAVVVAGEILPKLLAHRAPHRAAVVLLPLPWLLHRLTARPARALGRMLFPPAPAEAPVSPGALDRLLAEEGDRLLPSDERSLVRQLLELDLLRAGAVRRPLAATVQVRAGERLADAVRRLREQRRPWAAVVEEDGEIHGVLDLGRMPTGRTVREAMAPVPILPEGAPLARGAGLLRERGVPFLLLVDEYGQAAGILERGAWADTLLDRVPEPDEAGRPAIRRISGNRFEIRGDLPLHVFREHFGDPGPVDPRLETVAGLLAERLGRIPAAGDRLRLEPAGGEPLELRVVEVDGARTLRVQVTCGGQAEG